MDIQWKNESNYLNYVNKYNINFKDRILIYKKIKKKINKDLSITAYTPSPKAKNQQLIIYNKKTYKTVFLLIYKIGFKDSLDSETWSMCDDLKKIPYRKTKHIFDCTNNYWIGLKIIPIFEGDNRMDREIKIMQMVNKLILNNNSPNLQFYYGKNLLKDFDYRKLLDNQRLKSRLKAFYKDRYKIDMYLIYNEFSFSNLEFFIKKREVNTDIIHSLIFQVLAGLATLNKHYSIVHFDLHIGNILFNSIDTIDYIKYKIRNKLYYVPTHNYIFTIIDYSRSAILNSDMDNEIKKKFIFHCRKQFGIEFEYSIEQILDNLDKDDRYYKYIYSYDVYRFIKNLLIVTKNIDYDNKLLFKILEITKNDLTKKILTGEFKFNGSPINILTKYFKKFLNKKKERVSMLFSI